MASYLSDVLGSLGHLELSAMRTALTRALRPSGAISDVFSIDTNPAIRWALSSRACAGAAAALVRCVWEKLVFGVKAERSLVFGEKAERSFVWVGRLREASVVSEQLRASLMITECDRERTRRAVVYWISQIYPDSDYIP